MHERIRRRPTDVYRVALVNTDGCECGPSSEQLTELLASSFPGRFPGRVRLTIVHAGSGSTSHFAQRPTSASLADFDLLLAWTTEALVHWAPGAALRSRPWATIEGLTASLEAVAARNEPYSVPQLATDGVAAFLDRLVATASSTMPATSSSESPARDESGIESDPLSSHSQIARLAHAIRRLTIPGLPGDLRDPRRSVQTRLRAISGAR